MVSTNTKMYNLRWALATPSVADNKNSKLYKYSGQQDTNNKLWGASSAEAAAEKSWQGGGGYGQRTFLVRFRQGLLLLELQLLVGYAGTVDDGWVYCEKTQLISRIS